MNPLRPVREFFKKMADRASWVQARIIPLWQAGRPLPSPDDYRKFYEEGYVANPLVASCIWEIGTSACEPELLVKRKKKDGTLEVATGFDADMLRQIMSKPNPEQTTFAFLEQLFTYQQITGNWFVRKIRAAVGGAPVYLWPLDPSETKIVAGTNGWVMGYQYTGVKETIVAEDVIHDPLRPHPLNPLWGLGPISVLRRPVDLDNSSMEYLRVFFQNDATPSGLLKLKARVEPEERERIKELWTKEHSGSAGWHSVSVLDSEAEYVPLGASPEKLRLQAIWDHTESRICMAFGVPPILVGCSIGLNRSTFANYGEARKSFWQETLTPLYKRCGQRLTEGVAREFGEDLVLEFDLSKVEALSESSQTKREFAMTAYDKGFLTLDQALAMMGLAPVGGDEGAARKKEQAPPDVSAPGGFGGLLDEEGGRRAHEHHARTLSPLEKRIMSQLRKVAQTHFSKQKAALVEHLSSGEQSTPRPTRVVRTLDWDPATGTLNRIIDSVEPT